MLFIDPFFLLIFLPLTLLVFWLVGRRVGATAGLTVTALASVLFYAKFGLDFAALLIASVAVNFLVGFGMVTWADAMPRVRVALLVLGQVVNFGLLIFFKYIAPLFASSATPAHGEGGLVDLAIPVGISFYTFHQAVFLADAYARKPEVLAYLGIARGVRDAAGAAIRYAAFILFFPQLVIGPIVYLSEFAASTLRSSFGRVRRVDLEVGITLVAIGFFKKVAIADQLAQVSSPAFAALKAGEVIDPISAWTAALSYYFQLYFDFSGYSDMAIGLARMFAIRFPANFDSPLRAAGIVDFYKRWHITLTRVISRFLFTPLSAWGIRAALDLGLGPTMRKVLALWLPLLLNFQIIGLWHGATLTFTLFGVIHGLWYIIETEVGSSRRWRKRTLLRNPVHVRLLGQALTFLPLMLTFALFASPDLWSFWRLLQSMFSFALVEPLYIGGAFGRRVAIMILAGAAAIVWLLPNSNELLRRYRPVIWTWRNESTTPRISRLRWRPSPVWAVFLFALFAVGIWYHRFEAPFLYQGF
jgi:D-alanyl-lipoteichoic acid acyltransferase DltB (MBOAT superfamily)